MTVMVVTVWSRYRLCVSGAFVGINYNKVHICSVRASKSISGIELDFSNLIAIGGLTS